MPTEYVRNLGFEASLNDDEVLGQWRFIMNEVTPACKKVDGAR